MTGSNLKSNHTFLIAFLILVFSGCELETERYSFIPQIEFKELTVVDTIDLLQNKIRQNKLHFYLIDGNGDIGDVPCFDGADYYPGNCLIELHYYDGDKYVYDSTFPKSWFPCYGDSVEMRITQWYSIPSVGDLGQDKALKADVFIDIEYTKDPLNLQYHFHNNFFYKITVFDQKLNKSNVLNTDTIIME
jgi:hypothetical protein